MEPSIKRLSNRRREEYVTTLGRLFDYATLTYSKRELSSYVDGTQSYTYKTFRHKVIEINRLLCRFGISAGDKVALLSQNMPNWTVAMFSVVSFGRVFVPILTDSSEAEVTNILTHSEAKVLFVSKQLYYKVNESLRDKMTLIIDIESLEFLKKDDSAFTCEGCVKEPQPDDLAAIFYTSGTSGNAKGVMLSHRNLCHNVIVAWHVFHARKTDVWLSVLPMAHTYEMAYSLLFPLFVGAKVTYLHRPPTPAVLLSALKQVRPTVMLVAPLIIEKVYKGSIVPTITKSRVLSWMNEHTPRLLCRIVGKRLHRSFGGRLRFFGIGGAKLDTNVEAFLYKAKFPYAIGYGLTETAPLVASGRVGHGCVGSVGTAAYEVEVKLDNVNPETGEGEIIARGENVMLGYYKDPERTRQAINDEGWFHTNDLATIDKKGRIFIKGRLNAMILGPSGENIYPEEIEQVINDYEGVNESVVVERDGHLVALVKFDDNFVNWDQEGEDKFFENLQKTKDSVLKFVNKQVGSKSKVSEVEVMKEEFEKTATHKIRRFKYQDAVGDDVKAMKEAENH
ncbi:MAG: AMP-binding protein [Paludibacteraceae bacterium]|nr:AMP-binding protein [Paludibacteraceae bacterium]